MKTTITDFTFADDELKSLAPPGWQLNLFETEKVGENTIVRFGIEKGDKVYVAQFQVDDIEEKSAHVNWRNLALDRVRYQFQVVVELDD